MASIGSGKITGFVPYKVGDVEFLFVKVENTPSDTPQCNGTHRYVMKNSGNPHFKYVQSVVLTAFMAGIPVQLIGNGTCDAYDNSETLWFMCVGNTSCFL